MNDTSPEINAKMIEMIQKKKPGERLVMGCSMFDFSKRLVIASLLKERPDLAPTALRRELFLRFYRNDFEPKELRKILAYFEGKR